MAPRDLVTAQFALTFDPDPQIAEAAAKSLGQLDDRIAKATLSDTAMNPFVLDYLAERLQTRDALLEQILLNQSTPDTAFIRAAESCSEKICDIICLNQARLLQAPEIARTNNTLCW